MRGGFSTLLYKEVLRFWKVAAQTVAAPVLTALLYLLIFSHVLEGHVKIHGIAYSAFLIPGLVIMSVLSWYYIVANFLRNAMIRARMEKVMRLMAERQASDVFLSANMPILIKIHGQVLQLSDQVLTPQKPRQLDRKSVV